jgi:hypothetical protein
MATQAETLWATLGNGIKSAAAELRDAFITKDPQLWTQVSNQTMIPVAQKVNTTVANVGGGILSLSGLAWPIILVLLGAIAVMFLLRKFGV